MDPLSNQQTIHNTAQIDAAAQDDYNMYGKFLDAFQEPALLMDPMCEDCPIVGCSPGMCKLTGYQNDELFGKSRSVLFRDVPTQAISKSAQKDFQDYCRTLRVAGLHKIPEISSVQPNSRKDGSLFVNLAVLGLCEVEDRIFILGVYTHFCEGLIVRFSKAENSQAMERARDTFAVIKDHLRAQAPVKKRGDMYNVVDTPKPDFEFFSERLQKSCVLTNQGYTAVRREPSEVGANSMVFGDRPLQRLDERGLLAFEVRIDEVTSAFDGLPVLGFTRRAPKDDPELYPATARCLGQSVLIGASGEAFARDQYEHFKIGFKKPPPEEVKVWAWQSDLPPHQREAPVNIAKGDVLQCRYLPEGRIQMLQNGHLMLDFDVERPPDAAAEYYAVVDVCFAAASLTVMPLKNAHDDAAVNECELDLDDETCPQGLIRQTVCAEHAQPLNKHTLRALQDSYSCKSSSCRHFTVDDDDDDVASDRSTEVGDFLTAYEDSVVPTCSSLPAWNPRKENTKVPTERSRSSRLEKAAINCTNDALTEWASRIKWPRAAAVLPTVALTALSLQVLVSGLRRRADF